VWQRRYANHAEARRDITQYIVGFYKYVSYCPTSLCR
jgi:putative transposase